MYYEDLIEPQSVDLVPYDSERRFPDHQMSTNRIREAFKVV